MKPNRPAPDRCPGYPVRPAEDDSPTCGRKVPGGGGLDDHYWCIRCRKIRAGEIQNEQTPPGGIGPTVDNLVPFPLTPQISPDRWFVTAEKTLDRETSVS